MRKTSGTVALCLLLPLAMAACRHTTPPPPPKAELKLSLIDDPLLNNRGQCRLRLTAKFLGSPIIGQPGKVFLVDQAGTNLLEAGSGTTDENGSFDVIVANNLAPSGYQAELTNGLLSNRVACELFGQTH